MEMPIGIEVDTMDPMQDLSFDIGSNPNNEYIDNWMNVGAGVGFSLAVVGSILALYTLYKYANSPKPVDPLADMKGYDTYYEMAETAKKNPQGTKALEDFVKAQKET